MIHLQGLSCGRVKVHFLCRRDIIRWFKVFKIQKTHKSLGWTSQGLITFICPSIDHSAHCSSCLASAPMAWSGFGVPVSAQPHLLYCQLCYCRVNAAFVSEVIKTEWKLWTATVLPAPSVSSQRWWETEPDTLHWERTTKLQRTYAASSPKICSFAQGTFHTYSYLHFILWFLWKNC